MQLTACTHVEQIHRHCCDRVAIFRTGITNKYCMASQKLLNLHEISTVCPPRAQKSALVTITSQSRHRTGLGCHAWHEPKLTAIAGGGGPFCTITFVRCQTLVLRGYWYACAQLCFMLGGAIPGACPRFIVVPRFAFLALFCATPTRVAVSLSHTHQDGLSTRPHCVQRHMSAANHVDFAPA